METTDFNQQNHSLKKSARAVLANNSTGQDNSLLWDPILNRMQLDANNLPVYHRRDLGHVDATERPTNPDYDRYIYLVDFF